LTGPHERSSTALAEIGNCTRGEAGIGARHLVTGLYPRGIGQSMGRCVLVESRPQWHQFTPLTVASFRSVIDDGGAPVAQLSRGPIRHVGMQHCEKRGLALRVDQPAGVSNWGRPGLAVGNGVSEWAFGTIL